MPSPPPKMKKVEETKEDQRNRTRAHVLMWYMQESGNIPPKHAVEDKKPYKDLVYWHLEPLIPNVVNPVVIEEDIGGGWSIRISPMKEKVSVYV
jgi:hypothetical protein